ncbi:hypothetical protein N507_2966 [Lacticaseibacillus rhamnosus DSM 14870]|nr:hypothetical protein N507_2966 [Lacticaseibacillus rhamnosus DSM 14870]
MSLASQIHVFIAARTHRTNGRAPDCLRHASTTTIKKAGTRA